MIIRIFSLLFITLLSYGLIAFRPVSVSATARVKAESFKVSAFIESQVSAENSVVLPSSDETLADPVNHPLLITVKLMDKSGQALSGKEVTLTSSRGEVDIIEATSKIAARQANGDVVAMQTDYTNDNGLVSFRVTSFIPGDVILSATADGYVSLTDTKVHFTALPLPAYLILSTDLPFSDKEFVFLSPDIPEQYLSPLQKSTKGLQEIGTKIKIPFWFLLAILVSIIAVPLVIFHNLFVLRRIRRDEEMELELIEDLMRSNEIANWEKDITKNSKHIT